MQKSNFNVLFFLVRTRENKRGLCPVYCRITWNGKRKEFSTGEFIDPKSWNAKHQLAIGGSSESELINTQLEIIRSNLKKCYLTLQLAGVSFGVEDILIEYKGEAAEPSELLVLAFFSLVIVLLLPVIEGRRIERILL